MTRRSPVSNPKADLHSPESPCSAELHFRFRCYRTPIPKLLDMLAIEGTIVMIDAMRCQRGIAQKVIDKKAHYVLALKGNQGSLRDDVELFAKEQKATGAEGLSA